MVTTQLLGRDYFVSGDQIDDYSLLEIIGGGGEGGVWSGWDNVNERIVALKFFHLDNTSRPQDKRREELLALAEIEHPNIRTVYSTGDGPDYFYFAMAYYPSGSLADLLHGRPLDPGVALKTAAQITKALDFIHSNMLIHRDLKPNNILVDHNLHAFLTDFGIARVLSDFTVPLHTGQGTPVYSSPEQHTKAYIDITADIYSFGVMLFEIFTGEPPWQGLSSLALRQMEDDSEIPDPRESNPELPTELHGVLKKITAHQPKDRPDSIVEAFEMVLGVWDPASLGSEWRSYGKLSLDIVFSQIPPIASSEEDARKEAEHILSRTMGAWRQAEGNLRMGLTTLIFLDNIYRRSSSLVRLNQGQISFLTMFSVIHGRNASFWWDKVLDPKMKLAVAENILEQEVGPPVLNLIDLVLLDPEEFSGVRQSSDKLEDLMLEQVNEENSPDVIQKAIMLLNALTQPSNRWKAEGFSVEKDHQLAEMALSTENYAVEAAELIGRIRSKAAVSFIQEAMVEEDSDASLQALSVIREQAGNWPSGVPAGLRLQSWFRIFQEQVLTDWSKMGRQFLTNWLGAGLAFFFHVFITTRLPAYLLPSRILNSIGSGLLFGPIIGAGVLVSKWLSKRLRLMSRWGRLAAGVVVGGLLVNLGFLLFHILFLSSPPTGFMILLGSIIFPLGFGLGETFSLNRGWRVVLGTVFTFTGLLIPYIFASSIAVSPMLYYEREEPLLSVLFMFGFSIILSTLPLLFREPKQNELL